MKETPYINAIQRNRGYRQQERQPEIERPSGRFVSLERYLASQKNERPLTATLQMSAIHHAVWSTPVWAAQRSIEQLGLQLFKRSKLAT